MYIIFKYVIIMILCLVLIHKMVFDMTKNFLRKNINVTTQLFLFFCKLNGSNHLLYFACHLYNNLNRFSFEFDFFSRTFLFSVSFCLSFFFFFFFLKSKAKVPCSKKNIDFDLTNYINFIYYKLFQVITLIIINFHQN